MKTVARLLVVILCLALPRPSTAQNYFFQRIPSLHGLSSMVRCLEISPQKGYVWIGTRTGIGRFDGYEQKRYLRSNVTHLLEDQEQTLWAITDQGVFQYDERQDEFLPVRDEDQNPLLASSLCLWKDGIIFGGHGRIYRYRYEDHTVRLFHTLKPNTKYHISHLYPWDERTLLAVNRWSKALLIDTKTGRTQPAPFNSNEIISLLIDSQGLLWVSHYNQGVCCYDRNGQRLQHYTTENSPLHTNVILSLEEYNGRIWLGTDGGGIYMLNPSNQEMTQLKHIPGNNYSLPANSILCLHNDRNNQLWAGSVRNGLIQIKEVNMQTYQDVLPGQTYGLSEKTILSLHEDAEGTIWIGTDGGGINRLDPSTGQFQHMLSTWPEKVASITSLDERRLLLSLFNKGLHIFDKQTQRMKRLTLVNDSLNNQLCLRGKTVNVYQCSPEHILMLCETPYLYHWPSQQYFPIQQGPGIHHITGTLLPISQHGDDCYLYDFTHLYHLNLSNRMLKALYTCQEDTVFRSVAQDENGLFWIGSNYGLSSFQPTQPTPIFQSNTLIHDISSLICDRQGRVWIGAEGKLFAHLIRENKQILFGEPDGVLPNEYLEKPRLHTSSGDLFLGGVNGLLHIRPQQDHTSYPFPVLQLGDVYVSGNRVNEQITRGDRLSIEEKDKPIIVKMHICNKDIFRKPMIRYTLKGFHSEPVYSDQPEITLSSLPAGHYILQVACSTRTGDWSPHYQILTLVVLPPWYRSGWFILSCIGVLILLTLLIFFSLLRRKENKLKWAMKEHEQQVYEEKVQFLINVSHELRTPLTLIHAPLKQLVERLAPQQEIYPILQNICKQSERMKNILNTVLNVRKMEVGQSVLHLETVPFHPWLSDLLDDFRPETAERGIHLILQDDHRVETLCFDLEKGTIILTNLLINALKYSPDQSTLTIQVTEHADTQRVRIAIIDQGPGLKDVDSNSLFVRFYQGNHSRPGTGIGLSYAKILVEQHGGSIGAYDHSDTGQSGSTFWIELPTHLQPGSVTLEPQAYLNELLAPTQDLESRPETSEEVDTTAYTLLVVDDNKDLTDYLYEALKDRFRHVWIATDGKEALQSCREHHPDIVISDIQMPRMNGYELCKRIKEDLEISHIPVILLTARNDAESRLYGYKNGADAYLTKPFEVDMLQAMIGSQLANRQRMRTRYVGSHPLPPPEESTFSSADETFLLRLNHILTEHLDDEQMGIPFLCDQLHMSRASLYNKLKALTSMGANEYITQLRMEKAIELLTHTPLSINEIADQTGFSTARYFSTVFKQHTGLSPSQYRETPPSASTTHPE